MKNLLKDKKSILILLFSLIILAIFIILLVYQTNLIRYFNSNIKEFERLLDMASNFGTENDVALVKKSIVDIKNKKTIQIISISFTAILTLTILTINFFNLNISKKSKDTEKDEN